MPTIVAGHTRHEPTAMNQINQTVTVSDWQPGQGDADTHWSECIRQTDATNVAHLPGWRSAIQNAYGHRPVYLQASDDAGNSGVLPAFLVQHRVFGTVLSSMPFLDAGGPCSSSPALNQGLIEALMQQAEQLGANLVEIRCPQALPVAAPSEGEKVTLVLPLPDSADELWSSLNAKVRNQVRKAERSGLSVEIGQAEQLDAFYEPFIVNMRDLGSPVHGRQFFSAITDAFGDQVWVAVVRKGNTPIGGLIAVACQDSLVVPWASCLREYFPCVRICCCIGKSFNVPASRDSAALTSAAQVGTLARIALKNSGDRKKNLCFGILCRLAASPNNVCRVQIDAGCCWSKRGKGYQLGSRVGLAHRFGNI